MGIQHLAITEITLDPELQSRLHINVEHWREIADWLNENPDKDTTPIEVVFDGETHWVWDGFHRAPAYRAAKRGQIPAIIQPGTRRDALLLSFGANPGHGLKRSHDDKRKAVNGLLADEEWSKWSARVIAKKANVSADLVNRIKRENAESGASARKGRYQDRKDSGANLPVGPHPPISTGHRDGVGPTSVKVERSGKVYTQRIPAAAPRPLPQEPYSEPAPKRRESEEANMERCRENFRRLCRELSPSNTERLKPALVAMEEALEM